MDGKPVRDQVLVAAFMTLDGWGTCAKNDAGIARPSVCTTLESGNEKHAYSILQFEFPKITFQWKTLDLIGFSLQVQLFVH